MRWLVPSLVLLALLAGVWFATGGETGEPVEPDPEPPTATEPDAVVQPAEKPGRAEPEPRSAREVIPRPKPSSEPAPTSPGPEQACLRGRFLLPGGAPAAGVPLRVTGSQANANRAAEHGLPESWTEPSTETGPDGHFRICFEAPRAYQFLLYAEPDGYVPVSWRWSGLEPGRTRNLGRVVLARGGSLLVRVERPDGSAAGTDWRVHASAGLSVDDDGRTSTRVRGTYDELRGGWVIEDMSVGKVRVSAYTRMANWIHADGVEVVAGEERECVVVYDGPDNSDRIVVDVYSRPIYTVDPAVENVMLVGGPLTEPLRCEREMGSQSHDFPDLEPGTYTVVIDDPNFLRWERSGVRPGEVVKASLQGSAAIRLDVVDAGTGEPVPDWSLSVRCEDASFRPDEFPVVYPGQPPPEDGLVDSLVPFDYTLILKADGYPPARVPVDALTAGEVRPVRVELSRDGFVAGTVRDESGRTLSGVPLELYLDEVRSRDVDWWSLWGAGHRDRYRVGTAESTGDGSFRIPTSDGGRLLLRAVGGSGMHALRELDHPAGGRTEGLEVTVSRGVTVSGRVLAPAGASFTGLGVRAGVVGLVPQMPVEMWDPGIDECVDVALSKDGSFRAGPFASGKIHFAVVRLGPDDEGATPVQALLLERTVELADSGEHELTLDARESWPHPLVWSASHGGAPPGERIRIDLSRVTEDAANRFQRTVNLDDRGVHFAVVPGDYRASFEAADGWWRWEDPQSCRVEAGRRAERSSSLPLVAGEIELWSEADDAPLAHAEVRLLRIQSDGKHRFRSARTSAEGRLDVVAPPGPIWVLHPASRRTDDFPPDVLGFPRFEWTVAGASPLRVHVAENVREHD